MDANISEKYAPSILYPEDRDSRLFQNVDTHLQTYMASCYTKGLTLTTVTTLNLTCKIWWGNVFGKLRHGWKDNIKTDLRLWGCERNVTVQNRILYLTFVMMKFWVLLHQNSMNNCLRNSLYKGIQIYITLGLFTLNPCSLILLTAVYKGPVKSASSTSVRAECSLYGPSKQYWSPISSVDTYAFDRITV
jgi:hypothetical protein